MSWGLFPASKRDTVGGSPTQDAFTHPSNRLRLMTYSSLKSLNRKETLNGRKKVRLGIAGHHPLKWEWEICSHLEANDLSSQAPKGSGHLCCKPNVRHPKTRSRWVLPAGQQDAHLKSNANSPWWYWVIHGGEWEQMSLFWRLHILSTAPCCCLTLFLLNSSVCCSWAMKLFVLSL